MIIFYGVRNLKYGMRERVYATLSKKVAKAELMKLYDKEKTATILYETTREFKAVIKRSPYLGDKKNICNFAYIFGAYIIALYRVSHLSVSQMEQIFSNGLKGFGFIKKIDMTHDTLTHCELVQLFKAEGVFELIPYICATDYSSTNFGDCNFVVPKK